MLFSTFLVKSDWNFAWEWYLQLTLIKMHHLSEAENLFNFPYALKEMWRLDFMLDFHYDSLMFKEL